MDMFQNEGAALLVKALLSLETEAECQAFLEDLMTGKEIADCGQRLLVARLLREQLVYSRIARITGASSATISRVNRCYTYGAGGYKAVLDRLAAAGEAETKKEGQGNE
jgi:TrpR-related protein YerC/YecD